MTVTDRDLPTAPRWLRRAGQRAWPAAGLVLVAGVAVSLLLPAGRHQWALSLIRQPARYTALSFTRPADLPRVVGHFQRVAISFAVANHEGRAMTYRYVVSSASGRRTRDLAQAEAVVASGATWSVAIKVRPHCAASPCRVTVSLPGQPEVIDFLAAVRPRPHARRHRAGTGRPR
jgi:hypothetical protein